MTLRCRLIVCWRFERERSTVNLSGIVRRHGVIWDWLSEKEKQKEKEKTGMGMQIIWKGVDRKERKVVVGIGFEPM